MVRCMLFLAPLVGLAVAHKPMERLMQTTKEHRAAATSGVSGLAQAASSALPAAMPDPQLKEINDAVQNGVDAFATFSKMANSDAFKLISQNATVIESVVSNMKILTAFKGFDKILQGGLTPEGTVAAFGEGMKNALDMVQMAMNKMGDPSNSVKSVTDIIKDPANADLVAAMNKGDKAAFDAIAEQYTSKDFPGINYKVLETLGQQLDTRQLLEKEGLGPLMKMVIDQDPVMSDIIRNPPNIPEMVKELTGQNI